MKNLKNRTFAAFLTAAGLMAGLTFSAPAAYAQGDEKPANKDEKAKKKTGDEMMSVNPDDPNAAKLYVIPVTGQIGQDFAVMPLTEVLKDAKKVQPDYIILYINTTWKDFRGRDKELYDPNDAANSFGQAKKVSEMCLLLTDQIRDDKEWVKKPELIALVKNALGPSAFLPFICPKIYYTSDAMHGGIGYLDYLFAGTGDEVVREKQRSLRLGWAEGIAVKGKHNPQIMRAMSREDYSLSYSLVGGKPVFYENITDGVNILTDDGKEGNADSLADMLAFKGNDVLTLNARIAQQIGFSEGTANSIEELAYELGVSRAYRVYRDKSVKVMSEWSAAAVKRRGEFMRLRDEQRRIQVDGQTSDERNQQRGKIKRCLVQMVELLTKYGESLLGVEAGDPDDIADQLRQRIAQIDQQIRLDRPIPRQR